MIPFEQVIPGILKIEGGYVANDAGKGPSNFGINAASHPGVDIKNLTKEQATEIYRQEYWDPIVSQLPADASDDLVRNVVDAGVNMGVTTALKMLNQSGPDLEAFQATRAQRYRSIVASNPAKYGRYESAWLARTYSNGGSLKSDGQTSTPPPAMTPTPRNLPPLPGDQATLVDSNVPLSLQDMGSTSDAWTPVPLDQMGTFPGPQPGDPVLKVSSGAPTGHVIQDVVPADQNAIAANVAGASAAADSYLSNRENAKNAAKDAEKFVPLQWNQVLEPPHDPFTMGIPDLQALSDKARAEAQASWDKNSETPFTERFGAAYNLSISNLAATANRTFNGDHRADPNFQIGDWIKATNTDVQKMMPENYDKLVLAQSQAEANDIAIKDMTDRQNQQTAASGSQLGTLGVTMAAGMADPVMAPTMLVGGAAVRGLGAAVGAGRATTFAGAAVRSAAEATASGLAYSGAKAALGDHIQASDVVMNTMGAAAIQLGIGTLAGSLSKEAAAGLRTTINDARIKATADSATRKGSSQPVPSVSLVRMPPRNSTRPRRTSTSKTTSSTGCAWRFRTFQLPVRSWTSPPTCPTTGPAGSRKWTTR